ncbi:MAG: PKD domain-containing protein, partial [Planctomycetota bacterium]
MSTSPNGAITDYAWDFDGNGTDDKWGKVQTWTYTQPGTYHVKLWIQDCAGKTDVEWKYIDVLAESPVADYTYSPNPPQVNQVVTFDASPSWTSDPPITNYAWDLDGDGTDDEWGEVVTWTYDYAATYNVKLWIQDSAGKTDVEWKEIGVYAESPVAEYTYNPNPPVVNQEVTFDASPSWTLDPPITNYAWDFNGDGTDDKWGEVVTWTYTQAGPYNVKLWIRDSTGKTDVEWKEIQVIGESPVADYTYSPNPPLLYQEVTFDASASFTTDPPITNYAWDLDGDGTDDKWGKIVTWTYTQAGTYHVKLWIRDSAGKTDVEWKYITVAVQSPVADFTYSPNPPQLYQEIIFDASPSWTSDPPITSYGWDLDGDGTDDKWGKVVTWTYTQAHDYNVKLWIKDSAGKTDVEWKVLSFGGNQNPEAIFSWSPQNPHVGETVTFDSSASSDPDGTIQCRAWDFESDGVDDVWGEVVTHTFTTGGLYDVKLWIQDNEQGWDVQHHDVLVGSSHHPIAEFTFSPPIPQPGETVTFDGSASSDPDGSIIEYAWDFDGDGTTDAYGKVATNVFGSTGTHYVKLTVKDNENFTGSKTKPVSIPGSTLPDLEIKVEDLQIPPYVVKGYLYDLDATVRNIGSSTAQYNFNMQFYQQEPGSSTWTAFGDAYLIFDLDPGESKTWGPVWHPANSGSYKIKVVVDCYKVINESNEGNNEVIVTKEVLPTIQITPSVKLDPENKRLYISAKIFNNTSGEEVTSGYITYTLTSSSGNGNGDSRDHVDMVYDTQEKLWKADCGVSQLNIGQTYKVTVYHYLGHGKSIDFLNASGLSYIYGRVFDDGGDPVFNARVDIYQIEDYYPARSGPTYTTYTNGSGAYSFEHVDAGTYKATAEKAPYMPFTKSVFAVSDKSQHVDFTLCMHCIEEFKLLLDPLKFSCQKAMKYLAEDMSTMCQDFGGMETTTLESTLWDLADFGGSILVGAAADATSVAIKATSKNFMKVFKDALAKATMRALKEEIQDFLTDMAESTLHGLLQEGAATLIDIQNSSFYGYLTGRLNNYHVQFKSAPDPQDFENFDFDRAQGIISYVAQDLDNIREQSRMTIPISYDKPIDFFFPNAKDGFYVAYDANQAASAAHKGLVLAQIGLGIAAVVGAPFTGGASLALIPVAQAIGAVDTVVEAVETATDVSAAVAYGTALGTWYIDEGMIPTLYSSASDLILDEGNDPKMLKKGISHNVRINGFDLNEDYNFLGIKCVIAPWEGGTASHGAFVQVKNMDSQYSADIFVRLNNQDWRNYKDIGPGNFKNIDGGSFKYDVEPFDPWAWFLPRFFMVEIVANSPVPIEQSDHDEVCQPYWAVPKPFWARDKLSMDTVLPMSTTNGQAKLGDITGFYPTQHNVWEGDLDIYGPEIEAEHTVSADASSVVFCCTCPKRSMIEFLVMDENGNRIGFDYARGENVIEVPGEYSGR